MSVYTPTSVLLTGGAGFIGSHVLCVLVPKYPNVQFVCLDKLDYCANLRNLEEISSLPNFHFVKGDITSADLVAHILSEFRIDTVMHFAAQSHVDNSFGNSFEFTKSNVMGTHVLLEACKTAEMPVRRFIHVSTDEVYGENDTDDGFSEHASPLKPTNPYAATKAAAEMLVNAYSCSFGLPCIITRGNNVYGPRQYPEKLIPKFIHLLEQGEPVCLHGDGSHRRSFLHVHDVARAFDLILSRGQPGEVYNIGTEFEITNREVAEKLVELYHLNPATHITYVRDRDFNDRRYHISNTKLLQLGWSPSIPFAEGLQSTKDWYHNYLDYFGNLSIKGVLKPHPTHSA